MINSLSILKIELEVLENQLNRIRTFLVIEFFLLIVLDNVHFK